MSEHSSLEEFNEAVDAYMKKGKEQGLDLPEPSEISSEIKGDYVYLRLGTADLAQYNLQTKTFVGWD
jgi:hypothetical protein